jgi:hypothetical protein
MKEKKPWRLTVRELFAKNLTSKTPRINPKHYLRIPRDKE